MATKMMFTHCWEVCYRGRMGWRVAVVVAVLGVAAVADAGPIMRRSSAGTLMQSTRHTDAFVAGQCVAATDAYTLEAGTCPASGTLAATLACGAEPQVFPCCLQSDPNSDVPGGLTLRTNTATVAPPADVPAATIWTGDPNDTGVNDICSYADDESPIGCISGTAVGSAPALSSCGTDPSVVGADQAFTITVGSGTITACTATFAVEFDNAPACVANDQTADTTPRITSSSTTAITITFAADASDDVVDVLCKGWR